MVGRLGDWEELWRVFLLITSNKKVALWPAPPSHDFNPSKQSKANQDLHHLNKPQVKCDELKSLKPF